VRGEDGGGAGVWRELLGEGAGVEDRLGDGAAEGEEFEVTWRERVKVDRGGEFYRAAGEGLDEGGEEVRAGEQIFVFGGPAAGVAAGGVDVEK
jgi:hypothetical protein